MSVLDKWRGLGRGMMVGSPEFLVPNPPMPLFSRLDWLVSPWRFFGESAGAVDWPLGLTSQSLDGLQGLILKKKIEKILWNKRTSISSTQV